MYYRFCLALHRQPVKTVSMFEQYSLDTKKTGDALQKEMAEWSISEKTGTDVKAALDKAIFKNGSDYADVYRGAVLALAQHMADTCSEREAHMLLDYVNLEFMHTDWPNRLGQTD